MTIVEIDVTITNGSLFINNSSFSQFVFPIRQKRAIVSVVVERGHGEDRERMTDEVLGEFEVIPEDSFKSPIPSSPDTLWTPSQCNETEAESVLRGDFQIEPITYRNSPDLTLAIIKPDGMKYLEEIERSIREDGFYIVQRRLVHLSPEQASNFYYEHYGKPHFPALVAAMSSAPIKVFVLRGADAVLTWKKKCGPTSVNEARKKWPESLRALYGTPGQDHMNVCHASKTPQKALEEIRFFFPHMILDPNILDEIQVEDYLRDYVNPTLLEGLSQVCRNKPIDPVLWLAEWLLMNNPYKPKMEKTITLTPT